MGGLCDNSARPTRLARHGCDNARVLLESQLSPLATPSYPAVRMREEEECSLRTPFQRDRDRIVHSKAFRRLKHKTQVFVAPEGDHYRTRLTHTLEVTAISRTVARALALNEDLVEAIGLGHDLGHTPFGHIGEAALDACLRERFGGEFRHYEHSVRVAQVLEDLNLTDDVVDGILCHSGRAPMPRTLEGRIVRLVEPIAALGDTGSRRIDTLVHDLVEHSADAGDIVQGEAAGGAMDALRTFMFDEVYLSDKARREQAKIDTVIRTLFEHHVAHPETLPPGDGDLAQRVTDWIAGMTDRYCIRAFEELSVPTAFAL